MNQGARKSLYIFLSSLLGTLLFLILHRVVSFLFGWAIVSGYTFLGFGMNSIELQAMDYLTLMFSLMFGAWYGIWLGLYWYEVVYEQRLRGGLVDHIICNYWPRSRRPYDLKSKVSAAARKLEHDLGELESLAETVQVAVHPEPIKKRIVRKRAPVAKI